jgi:4'-phosphopantetheinyl transferase EntD
MKFKDADLLSILLPPGVAGADLNDCGQPVPLHPLEAPHVAGAVEGRRRDFALGRFCARTALARLGMADVVIGRDERGRPLWPTGAVGSITHTKGYAAALAARQDQFVSVGVDAERTGGISDAMLPLLFNEQERVWLEGLDAASRTLSATILFSAKEACFKAWNAASGRNLTFRDLHIDIEKDHFIAQDISDNSCRQFTGRFIVRDDLVVVSLCIPREVVAR